MADVLEARSAEQKRLAKENEKQAKVLKSVENYEKHLAKKQILAPITEKALGKDALEEAVLAEEIAEAKKLSRRERKALVKEERAQLIAVADELEAEARANKEKAKEARAAAKSETGGKRAEKALKAEALEAKSIEQKRLAKESKKQAEALKNEKNYEKYLANKEIIEFATERVLGKKIPAPRLTWFAVFRAITIL